uniref:EamA domain-containing protein n=1 Tax=Aegilops tauschii subsp. strangulata TaxID=200361 RepID=A0A453R362_AEGTS
RTAVGVQQPPTCRVPSRSLTRTVRVRGESCALVPRSIPQPSVCVCKAARAAMGVGKKVLNDVKPYMMMILLQIGYAGMYIVSVASLKRGMSHYVLVTYRNLVATLVMLPFALFFEKGTRPKMTLRIFIKILGLALLEPVLDQNLYYVGNKLTSASFSSALVNILPAVTFIMAIVLRMEKLRLRSSHSQAKVAGTICTVIGAVLMIMYHGPVVQFPWARGAHHVDQAASAAAAQSSATWLKGTIAIITSCVAWAGFFVLQVRSHRPRRTPLMAAAASSFVPLHTSVPNCAAHKCMHAVEHAQQLPGGADADDADLRDGHWDQRLDGAGGGAPRHERVGHRPRHPPLHRRLLGRGVLRRGLLRAGHRDGDARAGVRDRLPAPLHDHHRRPRLRHPQGRDHSRKCDWRGDHRAGPLLPHLGQEQRHHRQARPLRRREAGPAAHL